VTPKCTRCRTNPRLARQRYCRSCATAYNREWREKNRPAINKRRCEAAEKRSSGQKARDKARSALAMAIRRGAVKRLSVCEAPECLETALFAWIADLGRPREIEWVCREHREIRRAELSEAQAAAARRAALAEVRSAFDVGFAALPERVQTALREYAAKGPAGITLSVEAPLYKSNLLRAFEAYRSGRFVTPGSLSGS